MGIIIHEGDPQHGYYWSIIINFKLNIWKKYVNKIISEINIANLKHSSYGNKEGEDSIINDDDRNTSVLFYLKTII